MSAGLYTAEDWARFFEIHAEHGGNVTVDADQALKIAAFLRASVAAEGPEPSDQVKQLLRDMTDPDGCWFDHHGGCQAHGYLSLQPGEKCPHAEAKELLASWALVKREGESGER